MRYPNLRYGNPTEFEHYAQFIPRKELCRLLRRSERTINDWLKQRQRIPYWVPELLRLRHAETELYLRRMNYQRLDEKTRRSQTAANDNQYFAASAYSKTPFLHKRQLQPEIAKRFLENTSPDPERCFLHTPASTPKTPGLFAAQKKSYVKNGLLEVANSIKTASGT